MINGHKVRQESLFYEEIDNLVSEGQDIGSMFPDEALECSGGLRGTLRTIRTIERHFPLVLHEWSATARTNGRREDSLFSSVTHLRDGSDDLRYHLPCPHNEHLIPLHDPLFSQLVVVMERGTTHRHPSDIDRLQNGNRGYNSRPTDGVFDSEELRPHIHRRELVRDRIPGMVLGRPEAVPEREIVELDDEPVYLEIERRTIERKTMYFGLEFHKVSGIEKVGGLDKSEGFQKREIIVIS